jgi:molybdopterin converting factor small subunit
MVILVKIFVELRNKIKNHTVVGNSPLNVELSNEGIGKISDILELYSIGRDETSHIFVNGVYSGFDKTVKDGDRVGIFPRRMGLLYKWYFTRAND